MEQQLNISLDKTTGVVCEECDNQVFQEGVILRKASRFLTGTAQEVVTAATTVVESATTSLTQAVAIR